MNPRDRLLAACRREPVDCTPVWFMRQAGRYLPQYKEIRKDRSVIEVCKTPSICSEVTLLPVKELGVDAAVMFADIMLPLEGMGVSFSIEENLGPIISDPIRSLENVERLKDFDPTRDVPYLIEAIKQTKFKLEKDKIGLIGFSGAPFTIASYLIEGRPSRDYAETRKLMYNDSESWNLLLSKLSDTISEYLLAQIEAGVDCVQLFDSWIGVLSAKDYAGNVAPYTKRIFDAIKKERPEVPTIHFGTGNMHLLSAMKEKAGGDVFSLDWRVPISEACRILGNGVAIQGNLDPAVLLSDQTTRGKDFIASRVQQVLDEAKESSGHIFNLGHGVLRETPVENAKFVVNYVHSNTSKE
jgi:uroporphyrinogen decarboxylase